jgi:hypothetical protein
VFEPTDSASGKGRPPLKKRLLLVVTGLVFLIAGGACTRTVIQQVLVTATPESSLTPEPSATVPPATATPGATSTALPTAAPPRQGTVWDPVVEVRASPGCLALLSSSYRVDVVGKPKVVAEVENRCTSSYSDVKVTIALVDVVLGLQIDATGAWADGEFAPGDRASFAADSMRAWSPGLRARDGAWDTVVIAMQGLSEPITHKSFPGLVARDILPALDESGEVREVSYLLYNDTGHAVQDIRLALTGYDADGKAVVHQTGGYGYRLETGHQYGGVFERSYGMVSTGQAVTWSIRALASVEIP